MEHIQSLKWKCAVGSDSISASFLKDTKFVIAKPLTNLKNLAIKKTLITTGQLKIREMHH